MISNQAGVALKKFLIRTTTPGMRRQMLSAAQQAQDLASQLQQSMDRAGSLPDFIIIGAQKAGTTYLYDELIRHPRLAAARTKEIHFFDQYYQRGLDWYRTFFPRPPRAGEAAHQATGEASPGYLFHPHAARRVSQALPGIKLIALLRNPVERAYSHYHHEVRLGYETLSFEDAIEQEEERLAGEVDRMHLDDSYCSHNLMHFSYLARGHYLDQLRAWHQYFPQEQILLLASEDLQRNTTAVISQVGSFLGLEGWEALPRVAPKIFPYPPLSADVRQRLADYFQPHNQSLYQFVGADYGWN